MKSVLFVCNTMGQAGAEMAMMAMMAAMHRDGWQIDLLPIIPQGEMYGILPDYVHILGGAGDTESVHTAAGRKKLLRFSAKALLRKGWGHIGELWKSCRLQKKQGSVHLPLLLWRVLADAAPRCESGYDLAVAYLEGAATYYTSARVNAPVKVAFVHTDLMDAGYVADLDRAFYAPFRQIYTVSAAAKEVFCKMYPEYSSKTGLFRNMVDKDRILRMAEEGKGFDDGFEGLRLLSVGRLMFQKRYDVALQACAVMKKRGLPVRWYVIGTGDRKEELEQQRSELGLENDFVFLGALTNPYPFVSQCDMFMQTTGWEGRSIALFEAQVLCRPIIVSDCAGNLEQITDGVNGLVTRLEPESIADAVEELISHPEKRQELTQYLIAADVTKDNDLPGLYQLLG